LAALAGKPVKLRFNLRNGQLYGPSQKFCNLTLTQEPGYCLVLGYGSNKPRKVLDV